jgi:flagellar hook-length control protein FliK
MEMAGEVEVAADPGLLSGDQHDAPTSDDLETPSIPHARKFESSEAPVGYTETTQRAAVIHDTSVTTIHPGAADQRGIQTEPKPIMTQLIDHLRVAGNGEQQELSVQLTPENLGTVRVNIVADQLEVHARLLVENPAVKEILEANLHKLREALQAQGLHVQDISVSVSQHAPQHESMTGHLSYEERRWKNFRGLTTSGPIGEISAESGRGTLAADLCQVDLFA